VTNCLTKISDRITWPDGDAKIIPGIEVYQLGGHTPGTQIVSVETERGTVVLANDVVTRYENIENNWLEPAGNMWNLTDLYRAYAFVRMQADVVIPGHDYKFLRDSQTESSGKDTHPKKLFDGLVRLSLCGNSCEGVFSMVTEVNHGKETVKVNAPDKNLVDVIHPRPAEVRGSADEMLGDVMGNSTGSPPLEEMMRLSDRMTIIVDDKARPKPSRSVLVAVDAVLQNVGWRIPVYKLSLRMDFTASTHPKNSVP